MANFLNKKRFKTKKSTISVAAGLPAGKYIFQLTVIDNDGNISQPAQLKVEIVRSPIITEPVITGPVLLGPGISVPGITTDI